MASRFCCAAAFLQAHTTFAIGSKASPKTTALLCSAIQGGHPKFEASPILNAAVSQY
jgi:hypothetical protein